LKIAVVDIETDSVAATKVHCIVIREVDSSEHKVFSSHPNKFGTQSFKDFLLYSKTVGLWVAHNGVSFDIPVLNRLLDANINLSNVVDTFVVSRTVAYPTFNTHSLDEIGASLGLRKKPFKDFSVLTQEMIDYCKQDVDVNLRVYKRYSKYIWDKSWSKALRCEHDISIVCDDMQNNGFLFNRKKAEELLSSVTARMTELEGIFQELWPPELVETKRLKLRLTKDGNLHGSCQKAIDRYPKTEMKGSDLVVYEYKVFNPGSTKDRVDKLWEAGWSPTEKTKTHYEWSRDAAPGKMWRKTRLTKELFEEKKDHFNHYGWTVSEENLLTLPESAPEGAKRLAEWLTLEGRRSSLVEWLGQCQNDSRIHGKFWHIGTWTHRMSHSSPNSANISTPFHGEPKNVVEEIKADYDGELRALWCVPEGSWLVGTDAEGIQLRILAHYLKNDEYVHAIVEGKKEDETDIHNVNKRALGLNHITRDDAKTFIYAHVLGAGLAKTARILRANSKATKQAVSDFQSRLGLDVLRRGIIERDARRGYFDGLDGRKVIQTSSHLMLAGYLQNGEAVVMKHANLLWRKWADKEKIRYRQVNFVHDEWQTEVMDSLDAAERLGELQRNSIVETGNNLGVYCPLAGSTDIGMNWRDTH
jgi:DNA polymerase-1